MTDKISISLYELAYGRHLYGAMSGFDKALSKARLALQPEPDLLKPEHRHATLEFLRAWGCQHLAKADTELSSDALQSWWGACRRPAEARSVGGDAQRRRAGGSGAGLREPRYEDSEPACPVWAGGSGQDTVPAAAAQLPAVGQRDPGSTSVATTQPLGTSGTWGRSDAL